MARARLPCCGGAHGPRRSQPRGWSPSGAGAGGHSPVPCLLGASPVLVLLVPVLAAFCWLAWFAAAAVPFLGLWCLPWRWGPHWVVWCPVPFAAGFGPGCCIRSSACCCAQVACLDVGSSCWRPAFSACVPCCGMWGACVLEAAVGSLGPVCCGVPWGGASSAGGAGSAAG